MFGDGHDRPLHNDIERVGRVSLTKEYLPRLEQNDARIPDQAMQTRRIEITKERKIRELGPKPCVAIGSTSGFA